MHRPVCIALPCVLVLSCAPGPLDVDLFSGEGGSPADAAARADAQIRILSDVAPRPRDGRADSTAARDASGRDRELDVPDAPREGPAGAPRDAPAETTNEPNPMDACGLACAPPADHLLISEVVTRPSGAEMIEIVNPTALAVDLSDYFLSDSHLYYAVASGAFTTASGSDFAARFPEGLAIEPSGYVVVALGNASGGSTSFEATYGKKPDVELRPTANGASDDPDVPNMRSVGSSIGATASLTDSGEPIVLFRYREGALVSDVDYLYYGSPSASNPAVDKTGIVVATATYAGDTAVATQRPAPAPGDGGSLQRCALAEASETSAGGNGITGHDETSEDWKSAFVLAVSPVDRTPKGAPPGALCRQALSW